MELDERPFSMQENMVYSQKDIPKIIIKYKSFEYKMD